MCCAAAQVCICVCMYVCVYVCIFVCTQSFHRYIQHMDIRTYIHTYVGIYYWSKMKEKKLLKIQPVPKVLRVQAIRSKQLRNIYICYIHTYTHAHMHTYQLRNIYICYIHTYTHARIYISSTYTRTIRTYIHTYAYEHVMHTYGYTYIHPCIYIRACYVHT
jgi:hypothetical protein